MEHTERLRITTFLVGCVEFNNGSYDSGEGADRIRRVLGLHVEQSSDRSQAGIADNNVEELTLIHRH